MTTPRPYTLIAELTHRCPLRCPYCSNPIALAAGQSELDTETWCRVFEEAEALGVVQLHLTGGEPLARSDLERLVTKARSLDLYTNLITSGLPLDRHRLTTLAKAGIDNVQLSVQSSDEEESDAIAGTRSFNTKLEVARWVKEAGLPLTLNFVLHRKNIDRIDAIIALSERLGADRLELANTQYHGWAYPNRAALLPTPAQLSRAHRVALEAKERLEGQCEVVYVTADYYSDYPKACMDGWARRYIHIVPDGTVLPCHAAQSITSLTFDNAKDRSIGDIWENSSSFNAFRGDKWMREPCQSCDRKGVDFGGCRCQAFALLGDASLTDPACSLSPRHDVVSLARKGAMSEGDPPPLVYRGTKTLKLPIL